MATLNDTYQIDVDKTDQDEWHEQLEHLDDASIYQTWSYGAIRWGSHNLSHLVVKRENEVVGAAQVVVKKVPFYRLGIAYIPWGPLWKRKNEKIDPMTFRVILEALRGEYVTRRKLLLRVTPNIVPDNETGIDDVMKKIGFQKIRSVTPYRTLILDLAPSQEEIRKKFEQKWRNQLNRAEKNGLKVTSGNGDDLYRVFLKLQEEMQMRKKYIPGISYDEFRRIQSKLPEKFKMNVMVCEHNGEAISAAICSAIGETGIYLLGSTGNKGLTLKGAYLLQWKIIQWLKEKGCRWYDLGGINPERNPGVYHFKEGLGGRDIMHIGQFERCDDVMNKIFVRSVDRIRMYAKKVMR